MKDQTIYSKALYILWDFIYENDLEQKLLVGKFSYWWFFHYDAYYWLVNYLNSGTFRNNSYSKKVIVTEILSRVFNLFRALYQRQKFNDIQNVDVLCVSNKTSWQYISDGKNFFWDDAQIFLEQRELIKRNKKIATIELSTPNLTFRNDKFHRYSFELFRLIHKGNRIDFSLGQQKSRVKSELAGYVSRRISDKLEVIKNSVKTAEDIIKKTKPKKMLVTDENGSARIFTLAARNLRVPTVGVQHGIIHDYHPLYIYPKWSKYVPLTDKTAVFGNFSKEILVKKSIYKPESVVITGQLRTDIIGNYSSFNGTKIRSIPEEGDVILLVSSQNSRNYIKKYFSHIEKVKKRKKNSFIVVKLHPLEVEDDFYDFIKNKYFGDMLVIKNADLYSLLKTANVVVGTFSTVLAESLMFNKPIVVLDIPGYPDFFQFKKSNVANFCYNSKELNELLSQELKPKKGSDIDRFVNNHFNHVDGKVAKRITSLLE